MSVLDVLEKFSIVALIVKKTTGSFTVLKASGHTIKLLVWT